MIRFPNLPVKHVCFKLNRNSGCKNWGVWSLCDVIQFWYDGVQCLHDHNQKPFQLWSRPTHPFPSLELYLTLSWCPNATHEHFGELFYFLFLNQTSCVDISHIRRIFILNRPPFKTRSTLWSAHVSWIGHVLIFRFDSFTFFLNEFMRISKRAWVLLWRQWWKSPHIWFTEYNRYLQILVIPDL